MKHRAQLLNIYLDALRSKHVRCLAVLETMWGTPGNADELFPINPGNFTGKRLYWLLGHNELLCTNACREQVSGPSEHGTPDPSWLNANLQKLSYDLLLVCGKVAQATYDRCAYTPACRIIRIPHPAARGCWNKHYLAATQKLIQSGPH
jgi:hypothetical protein